MLPFFSSRWQQNTPNNLGKLGKLELNVHVHAVSSVTGHVSVLPPHSPKHDESRLCLLGPTHLWGREDLRLAALISFSNLVFYSQNIVFNIFFSLILSSLMYFSLFFIESCIEAAMLLVVGSIKPKTKML